MPASIVIVTDQREFLDQVTAALRQAGHDVAPFVDPMEALLALEAPQKIEILIPRIRFPPGKPNGVSLARMARAKCPWIKVLFTALPELAEFAEGVGAFMPLPVVMPELVKTVERMLKSDGRAS